MGNRIERVIDALLEVAATPDDEVDYELTQLATNLFGRLKPSLRRRLRAVIRNPTSETWEGAFSIILDNESMKTLWQAVLAVDPTFSRVGPTFSAGEESVWDVVPTREVLIKAIKYATH